MSNRLENVAVAQDPESAATMRKGNAEHDREEQDIPTEGRDIQPDIRVGEQPSSSPEDGNKENEGDGGQQNIRRAERDIRPAPTLEESLPRNLSSPLKGIRERAVTVLRGWLPSYKDINDGNLTRIWQGVLNCVWQTNKTAVDDLCKRVSLCLGEMDPAVAIAMFRVLVATMVGEWNGIDRKRVEKFRNLFRDCLNQTLRVLRSHAWEHHEVIRFAEAFEHGALTLHGLNVVLAQIYVEELRVVTPGQSEVLHLLLEPFFKVFASSGDRLVLQKLKDAVFVPLLVDARGGHLGLGALVLGLPQKFLELGASASGVNKKFLNQLHEDWKKATGPQLGPEVGPQPEVGVGVGVGRRSLRHKMKAPEAEIRITGEEKKDPQSSSEAEAEPATKSAEPEAEFKPDVEAEIKPEPEAEPEGEEQLPVTRSKRKRVDAGPQTERRVLRSDRHRSAEAEVQSEKGNECSTSSCPSPRPKRKRKSETTTESESEKEFTSGTEGLGDEDESGSSKKVRFTMRNNLVWTPHSPLPPQWVRVPPCAAPRGSAMKPGVLPGPIQEPSPPKRKRRRSKRKGKKKKVASTTTGNDDGDGDGDDHGDDGEGEGEDEGGGGGGGGVGRIIRLRRGPVGEGGKVTVVVM